MATWIANTLVITASILIILILVFMAVNQLITVWKNYRNVPVCSHCGKETNFKKGGKR